VRFAKEVLYQAEDNGSRKAAEIEAAAIPPSKPGAADSWRPAFYPALPRSPYTWSDVYAK
jgi:hypothetical protein